MCVIIVKPAGAEMPSKTELLNAHRCHPHGMGFASPTASYKGMSFEAFYKKLSKVTKEEPCIIHFRLATHGSVKRANCHPFKAEDTWFAHNGILSLPPRGDMTDSETAFRDFIYPCIKQHGINSKQTKLVIQALIGQSKFAFLQGKEITTFGEFTELGGRLYSNLRHMFYNRRAI